MGYSWENQRNLRKSKLLPAQINEKRGKSKNHLRKKLQTAWDLRNYRAKIHEKRGKPRIHVGKSTGCYQGLTWHKHRKRGKPWIQVGKSTVCYQG